MKCSVIIPTHHRASALAETLEGLALQRDKSFEVVVVCDGEDPETRTLAQRNSANFPLSWIWHPEALGQAAARNAGAEAAKSARLVFLDDDMTAVPDWVSEHCRHHEAAGNAPDVAVCGKVVECYSFPPRSRTEGLVRKARDRRLTDAEANLAHTDLRFGRYACFGVNCSIQRRTFLAAGGFTAGLLPEDYDLGTRLYDQGTRFIFAPKALARHRSTKDLASYLLRYCRDKGRSDVRRARNGGQRNAQTRTLARLHQGRGWRRIGHVLAWHWPAAFRTAAELCRMATDTTGLPFFYSFWEKLGVAQYWEGVRSEGETLESLHVLTSAPAPALMFHSIAVPAGAPYQGPFLSPQRFARLVGWLRLAGFCSVRPEEWLAGAAPSRSVMLTFDDGYENFYSVAFPLLQQNGLHATVFVVVDRIGQFNSWDMERGRAAQPLLCASQIRELHRHGVRFGSHSLTHPMLTRLSDTELRRQVRNSKSRLEDLLGAEVFSFAYPYGDFDLRVRTAVAAAGYKTGMTTKGGLNYWDDPLCFRRVDVRERDTLVEFVLKLATGRDIRSQLAARLNSRRHRKLFGRGIDRGVDATLNESKVDQEILTAGDHFADASPSK